MSGKVTETDVNGLRTDVQIERVVAAGICELALELGGVDGVMGREEGEIGEVDRKTGLEAQVGAQATSLRVPEPGVETNGDGIEPDGADALLKWKILIEGEAAEGLGQTAAAVVQVVEKLYSYDWDLDGCLKKRKMRPIHEMPLLLAILLHNFCKVSDKPEALV